MTNTQKQTEEYHVGLVRCISSITCHIGCDFGIVGGEKYCCQAADRFDEILIKEYGSKKDWLNKSWDENVSPPIVNALLDMAKIFFRHELLYNSIQGFIEPVKYATIGEHFRDNAGISYRETEKFPRRKQVNSFQVDGLLREIERFYNKGLKIPTKVIKQAEEIPRSRTGELRELGESKETLDFLTGTERKTIEFDENMLDWFGHHHPDGLLFEGSVRKEYVPAKSFLGAVAYLRNKYPNAKIII